ncbi:hypothetical protein [Edaphobacter aggregans]|uniref:hypothetical protein n=1 Tax=Edaphobacter aggregans TaxID=570835 RepID=UPI000F747BEF|nr:hypothetical protein [Edaphobacter aggregans]
MAQPVGVRGWLLYICIAFTILGPIKMIEFIHGTSAPIMLATYITIAVTSFIAGLATWATRSSAFLFLRIALVARLLYSFLQVYLGMELARQQFSTTLDLAKQEFMSAAINILLVLLLFFYFRFSKRVRNTFGRNI